jgi:hypothetical protein
MEQPQPTPTRREGHFNPFNGKCIHGKDGARFMEGKLLSPSCDACMITLHKK